MKASRVLAKPTLQKWKPVTVQSVDLVFDPDTLTGFAGRDIHLENSGTTVVAQGGLASASFAIPSFGSSERNGIYYKFSDTDFSSFPAGKEIHSIFCVESEGAIAGEELGLSFALVPQILIKKDALSVVTKTLTFFTNVFSSDSGQVNLSLTITEDTEFCIAWDATAGEYGTAYFYSSELPNTPLATYSPEYPHSIIATCAASIGATPVNLAPEISMTVISNPTVQHDGVTQFFKDTGETGAVVFPENCAGKFYEIIELTSPVSINDKIFNNGDVVWFDLAEEFKGLVSSAEVSSMLNPWTPELELGEQVPVFFTESNDLAVAVINNGGYTFEGIAEPTTFTPCAISPIISLLATTTDWVGFQFKASNYGIGAGFCSQLPVDGETLTNLAFAFINPAFEDEAATVRIGNIFADDIWGSVDLDDVLVDTVFCVVMRNIAAGKIELAVFQSNISLSIPILAAESPAAISVDKIIGGLDGNIGNKLEIFAEPILDFDGVEYLTVGSSTVVPPANCAGRAYQIGGLTAPVTAVVSGEFATLNNDDKVIFNLQSELQWFNPPLDTNDYATNESVDEKLAGYDNSLEVDVKIAAAKPLNDFERTSDPDMYDDVNDGFSYGSKIYNTATDEAFMCFNPAANGAVWRLITLDAEDLGAAAFRAVDGDDTSLASLGKVDEKIAAASGWIYTSSYTNGNDQIVQSAKNLFRATVQIWIGTSSAWEKGTIIELTDNSEPVIINAATGNWIVNGHQTTSDTLVIYAGQRVEINSNNSITFIAEDRKGITLFDGAILGTKTDGSATWRNVHRTYNVSPSNSAITVIIGYMMNGSYWEVIQEGTGQIMFTPDSGITMRNVSGHTKSSGQGAVVRFRMVWPNVVYMSGDTAA